MFIKLLIISVILVAFVMLALGIKMFFDPKSEFSSHSCEIGKEQADESEDCLNCEIKELANCSKDGNTRKKI
ncbi:MAG: hypothetical protein GXO81_10040 [Chlorobi bacterium]|nr:hypothetical protein [Chlorobiota bacterium]